MSLLVLIGDQGTGKGSFVEPLGQILGDHYQHATQMDKVLGRFNMHMAHALLIFCDEIVWGGNKKDEGVLKGLVTETDRLVEGKFQNPLTLPSYHANDFRNQRSLGRAYWRKRAALVCTKCKQQPYPRHRILPCPQS